MQMEMSTIVLTLDRLTHIMRGRNLHVKHSDKQKPNVIIIMIVAIVERGTFNGRLSNEMSAADLA